MQQKIIGVDADEVLWGLLECFLDYFNQRLGTRFTTADFHTYAWWDVLGIPQAEVYQYYRDFHASGAAYHVRPRPGAHEALQAIKAKHNTLIVVTARAEDLREETQTLVDRHFPGIFNDLRFCNYIDAKTRLTKAQVCQSSGITRLIEDDPHHAHLAAEGGVNVLLYGGYPWNHAKGGHDNIKEVSHWHEVPAHLGIA